MRLVYKKMPELPEVETVTRGLNKVIPGEQVKKVEVLRPDSIAYPKQASDFARNLQGHVFKRAARRGKYIIIELSDQARLVVHLRMSGRLVIRDDFGEPNFLRVRIMLKSGRELHFEDMRVFGRLWYVPSNIKIEKVVGGLAELGVEPLTDLNADLLAARLHGKKQPIKSALLDQRIIAGIGNIYADEALFLAGIHPRRAAGSLSKDELAKLVPTIVIVLSRAIELGGTTLRDYQDLEGANGNYQHDAYVYGRKGLLCLKCKNIEIERLKLAGRSSHFCPRCQPLDPRGAKAKRPIKASDDRKDKKPKRVKRLPAGRKA